MSALITLSVEGYLGENTKQPSSPLIALLMLHVKASALGK